MCLLFLFSPLLLFLSIRPPTSPTPLPSFPAPLPFCCWHGGVCWWCRVLLWNGKYKLNFGFHNLALSTSCWVRPCSCCGWGGRGMQRVSGRLALLWDLARCSPSSLLCGREKECGLVIFISFPLLPPLSPAQLLLLLCPGCMPWCGGVVVDHLHSITPPCPAFIIYLFPFFFLSSLLSLLFLPPPPSPHSASSKRASLSTSLNPKAVLQLEGCLRGRGREVRSDHDRQVQKWRHVHERRE